MNFTFNKALGAGVGSGLLSAGLPLLADFLNLIQPVANLVPGLGLLVGVGTFAITWLTKANAPKSRATL